MLIACMMQHVVWRARGCVLGLCPWEATTRSSVTMQPPGLQRTSQAQHLGAEGLDEQYSGSDGLHVLSAAGSMASEG